MIGDKALLSQFEEKADPLVTFRDNSKGFTMGYGKLVSENVVINNVALVAGLEVNLLSVSRFTDKVALKEVRKGSLFAADLDSINKDGICCFYTKASEEQRKLWHKKLSHLNFKEINTLVKKELVRDMPKLEFAQVEEEAVNTACYTHNRYLINKAHGKSPYSIISKRKPTVKYLHVFGSKCYIVKDNSEYVRNFDSKVFETIFLGYSLERTAYKVYVIDRKKVIESTYVTFDDDKCPGLECLDENEAEALAFENLNIDSDSDGEDEVNA
ncbi:hypothetical protein AgCh_017725 [Apium graveolens]